MAREPIGMTTDGNDNIHVVCDDGTHWKLDAVSLDWRQVGSPIPGSEADEGQQRSSSVLE